MGKDVFSNLPNEILGRIVSFLPNEWALETSLISRRWRELWNEALVKYGSEEDMIGVVAGFMKRFEELDPLKHPRKLQFHFAKGTVLWATVANNSRLMLHFSFSPRKEEVEMGGYEFELELKPHIHIVSTIPQTYHSFPTVKTLYLKSVTCFTSEVAASIVSNLKQLQNLVLLDCKGLQSFSVHSTSQLLKLTILDCLELKFLHLKTSKLKSFRYRGPLPFIRPQYHFNLTHAMLDVRLGLSSSAFKAKDFDATLLTIKNSQLLTLCKWTFQELIWPSISPLSGTFKFYKLRELWWIDKDEYNMDALFSFLKLCPSLEQLFVTIDPESYSGGGSNSCLMKGPKCTELEHLKVIKFMGFTSPQHEISLAKCLIHLIKGNPPIINTSDGSCLHSVFAQ